MEFFSETKFNAPIKGPNNESGNPELNIRGGVIVSSVDGRLAQIIINPEDQNVTIDGAVTIQSGESPFLSISPTDHRVDVSGDIWSTKSINTSDNITADGNISACGSISACGDLTAKNITSQFSINTTDLTANGIISGGTISASGNIITCGDIAAHRTIIAKNITGECSINTGGNINANGTITGGTINAQNSITLSGETITSWAELKGPAGPSIQRFTSPEVPANCSQFYFEGCNLVTGSELPFIQVRETATGKLVQMDVWVNLDGCCSGYTVGKPVANIAPCSTATEAGTWTAIVMN